MAGLRSQGSNRQSRIQIDRSKLPQKRTIDDAPAERIKASAGRNPNLDANQAKTLDDIDSVLTDNSGAQADKPSESSASPESADPGAPAAADRPEPSPTTGRPLPRSKWSGRTEGDLAIPDLNDGLTPGQRATAADAERRSLRPISGTDGNTGLGQRIKDNRKTLGVGGGLAGLILASLFGFSSLLPLKLEAVMNNVIDNQFKRVQHYAEKRVARNIYQAAVRRYALGIDDSVYIGKSVTSTFYYNVQRTHLLEKLKAEKNIEFFSPKRGQVEIRLADGSVSNPFTSESEMAQFLDKGALKGSAARKAISAFAKDNTKWWQVLKRAHIRRYMRNAFGIWRWGIPKKTDKEATPKTADAQLPTQTDVAAQDLQIDEQGGIKVLDDAVGGGNGTNVDARGSSAGQPSSGDFFPSQPNDAKTVAAEGEAKTTAQQAVSEGTAQVDTVGKKEIAKGMDAVLQRIFGEVAGKALGKAIPIVGWISLGSDIDNFMWNGHIREMIIRLHQAQYASVFADYASLDSQMREGQLGAKQINDILSLLDGVEKSNGFQRSFFGRDAGVKIDPTKGVNNTLGNPLVDTSHWPTCDASWVFKQLSGNGTAPPSDIGSADFWTWDYRVVASSPTLPIHVPLCEVHPILSKLSGLVGDIVNIGIDVLKSVFDGIVSFFTGQKPIGDLLNVARNATVWLVKWVFTDVIVPVASSYDQSAKLGNDIYGGADVTQAGFSRDTLGAPAMSYTDASIQQAMLNQQDEASLRQRGLIATLFDQNSPQSYASKFLAMMPATPSSALNQMAETSIAMITTPVKFFGSLGLQLVPLGAAAMPTTDPYGIQQFGYTEDQLNGPLQLPTVDIHGKPNADGSLSGPDGAIDANDCPDGPNVKDARLPDICRLDVATMEAMNATMDNADNGGLNGN